MQEKKTQQCDTKGDAASRHKFSCINTFPLGNFVFTTTALARSEMSISGQNILVRATSGTASCNGALTTGV